MTKSTPSAGSQTAVMLPVFRPGKFRVAKGLGTWHRPPSPLPLYVWTPCDRGLVFTTGSGALPVHVSLPPAMAVGALERFRHAFSDAIARMLVSHDGPPAPSAEQQRS